MIDKMDAFIASSKKGYSKVPGKTTPPAVVRPPDGPCPKCKGRYTDETSECPEELSQKEKLQADNVNFGRFR